MATPSIAATPDPACVREDRAIFRALRIVEKRAAERGPLLNDPSVAAQLFRLRLGNEVREHFEVAFLDNKHRLLAVERLFSGSIAGTSVHPRVLVQRALAVNAAAVIVAHNHPSGDPTPSTADRVITCDLRKALELVEIRLLDHVIVCASETRSMACMGMLDAPSVVELAAIRAPVDRRRLPRKKANEPQPNTPQLGQPT
jgi:DNA repair protein RadC